MTHSLQNDPLDTTTYATRQPDVSNLLLYENSIHAVLPITVGARPSFKAALSL